MDLMKYKCPLILTDWAAVHKAWLPSLDKDSTSEGKQEVTVYKCITILMKT